MAGDVLPWPGRDWDITLVPSAEPGTTQASFPATAEGRQVLATATASHDQVAIETPGGVTIEIPLKVWIKLTKTMTVHALAHTTPDLPPAERG